jgi:hypothetical protein
VSPTKRGSVRLAARHFSVAALAAPAPGKNHDAHLVRSGVAVVADGVTPLAGALGAEARGFADAVCERLAAHRSHPAPTMVRRTIAALADPGRARPERSCAVAAAHVLGDALELLSLGDCLAVVRLMSGKSVVAFDDRVASVEKPLEDELGRLLRAGAPSCEALATIATRLPELRRSANTPGGYWVLGADEAAASQVVTARVPLTDVEAVLLCSDGFARLWTTFRCAESAEGLLDLARRDGLGAAVARLRMAESAPDSLAAHPRLSPVDDATAVLLVAADSDQA